MTDRIRMKVLGVMGGSLCTPEQAEAAEAVGRLAAQLGAALLCGGGSGVMEAAARGAQQAGGWTLGILPGRDKTLANPYIRVAIPTGMGDARNAINVLAADLVVAIGGGAGTLSEIALALKAGREVLGFKSCRPCFSDSDAPAGFRACAELDELLAAIQEKMSEISDS